MLVFLWTMTAAQSSENKRDKRDLAWYFGWGIFISIPKPEPNPKIH